MIKKSFCAAAILSFALVGVVSAQGAISSAENGDHYTKSQLKQLERDAHTPGQYTALAQYYGKQQKDYAQQAAEEKQEWARRSQINKPVCQVPKACGLGTQPLRVLCLDSVGSRRSLSKVQPVGGFVRSLNTTAHVEHRFEWEDGSRFAGSLSSICNLYIFLTGSL